MARNFEPYTEERAAKPPAFGETRTTVGVDKADKIGMVKIEFITPDSYKPGDLVENIMFMDANQLRDYAHTLAALAEEVDKLKSKWG